MRILDLLAILCTVMLCGNELCVSLFINPVIRQLDEQAQGKITSLFARSFGKAMPLWYALSLLLLIAEAFLRRHAPDHVFLFVAVAIWIAVIAFTIAFLVPINNRIAAGADGQMPAGWHEMHARWETYHRLRILAVIIAAACLIYGLLESGPLNR